MPSAVLSAFLVFMCITAFTPGPNNILAMSAGIRLGFRKSLPVLAGICCGFWGVMLLCCLLTASLTSLSARFVDVMKYASCLYIAFLAWKIAFTKSEDGTAEARTGFLAGCILQFVNIKVIIYGMTAYSGFILPYDDSLATRIAAVGVLTFFGSTGTVVWALTGALLQRFFRAYARVINTVMALLLLACVVPLLFG